MELDCVGGGWEEAVKLQTGQAVSACAQKWLLWGGCVGGASATQESTLPARQLLHAPSWEGPGIGALGEFLILDEIAKLAHSLIHNPGLWRFPRDRCVAGHENGAVDSVADHRAVVSE